MSLKIPPLEGREFKHEAFLGGKEFVFGNDAEAISAGTLSGYEFGPGSLNPYEVLKHRQADDVIDYAVFIFNGHFEIPLAASDSYAQKRSFSCLDKRLEAALAEAQQSLALGSQRCEAECVGRGHPGDAAAFG